MNSKEIKKISFAPFWAKHPIVMLTIFIGLCFFSWPIMAGLTVMLINNINTALKAEKPVPVAAQVSTKYALNTNSSKVTVKPSVDLSVLISGAVVGEFRAVSEQSKVKVADLLDYAVAAVTSTNTPNLVPMPTLGDPWPGDSVVYKCSQTTCLLGLLVSSGDQSQKALLIGLRKNDPSSLFNVLPSKVDYKYTAVLGDVRTVHESQAQVLLNEIFK